MVQKSATKKRKQDPGATASAKKKVKTPPTGKKRSVKKQPVADELEGLLKKNDHLSKIETAYGQKVKCSLTGHEMPVKAEVVKKYLESKALLKAKNEWFQDTWTEKYKPDIVAHSKNPEKKLYCTITRMTLNKIPEEVAKHVAGKRFLHAKEKLEQGKQERDDDDEEDDSEDQDNDDDEEEEQDEE